jgi:hypothetical protein
MDSKQTWEQYIFWNINELLPENKWHHTSESLLWEPPFQQLLFSTHVLTLVKSYADGDWTCTGSVTCFARVSARAPYSSFLSHPLGRVCSCILQCFRRPTSSCRHIAETCWGYRNHFQSQGHCRDVSDKGWQTPSANIHLCCWVRTQCYFSENENN